MCFLDGWVSDHKYSLLKKYIYACRGSLTSQKYEKLRNEINDNKCDDLSRSIISNETPQANMAMNLMALEMRWTNAITTIYEQLRLIFTSITYGNAEKR